MKLICLNLWGGRQGKILFDYLAEQAKTTDIFCFQEVFDSKSRVLNHEGAIIHLFEELQAVLPDFVPYFAPCYDGWVDMERVDFQVTEGQAIFLRKGILNEAHNSIYIYGNSKTEILDDFTNEPKILQYCSIKMGNQSLIVANVHGMWSPGDKNDTHDRLLQSNIIKDFLDKFKCAKVLCGDFNLYPDTKSVKILEENLVNLIKTYQIESTRNEVSWKEYGKKQYFADYIFISPEINIKSFGVPYNEVSDHLPLVLDFSI